MSNGEPLWCVIVGSVFGKFLVLKSVDFQSSVPQEDPYNIILSVISTSGRPL